MHMYIIAAVITYEGKAVSLARANVHVSFNLRTNITVLGGYIVPLKLP